MKTFGVVSAVVLVLGLLVFGGKVFDSHFLMRTNTRPETRTLIVLHDARVALNNWIAEYDDLPRLRREALTEDVEIEIGGELLNALRGEPVAGNDRGIVFLEIRHAKPPKAGVVEQGGVEHLVDQWGSPLRVLLDGDGDSRLPNPDRKNTNEAIRSSAPEQLRTRVAVFSAGKDGVFFTKDDVVSWR
jgi:hypothetical protein